MLSLSAILVRLAVAVVLGGIIGLERELVGKEAGIRTDMLVASGAAIFAMVGLMLPYIGAHPEGGMDHLLDIVATSRGFSVIAGIVTGVGFLGAGLILKEKDRVVGVTTAASIWFVAAIGMLSGLGLIKFAAIAAVCLTFLLYLLRKIDLFNILDKQRRRKKFNEDQV